MNEVMKQFEIENPKEGVNTLVAQFAAFKLDEVVDAVRGAEDARAYMAGNYPDLDEGLVGKILTLAKGEIPADDFEEVEGMVEERDETTLVVDLGGKDAYVAGDLIYLRGRRWVVGSHTTTDDDRFVLKSF